MQSHDDYRQPQAAQLGAFPGYHLLLNPQNSTHDMNKTIPAASSGMYAPNTAAIPGSAPQHHQPGQSPATSMVQQQQINHRPIMMNSLPTRPSPQMANMSRNPMGNVSQATPQGPQQYSHVQNVMLQSHHNLHTPSMPAQPGPMMITHHPLFFQPRPVQYNPPQPPYFLGACYNYPPSTPNNTYYQMQPMPSCPATVNSIPDSQPPPQSKKKILTIINPNTGENVLEGVLQETAANENRENSRSGGSEVAVKFASQVAATVSPKEPESHRLSEGVGDPQSVIHSGGLCAAESTRDSGNGDIIASEICDPYIEEESLSSHGNPSVSFSNKERLEVNSISDTIPLVLDIEQDVDVLQTAEVVDSQNLVNYEELDSDDKPPPDYSTSIVTEVEDVVLLKTVDSETNITPDLETTNCAALEKEFPCSVDDCSSTALHLDVSEVVNVCPSSDSLMSNKIVDESLISTIALKTEKPQTEGKKSKGKKKKELNRKGESKEGSEMDAFFVAGGSTPVPASPPDVAPSPPVPSSTPQPTSSPPLITESQSGEERVAETVSTIIDSTLLNSIPLPDEVDVPVELNEVQTQPDGVLEVDAVDKKEEEEPLQLETPKIVLKYNYKEDQWSPLNPEGKKQYDRDFLLKLQSQPMSLKKPMNLPNLDVIKDKAQLHKLGDATRAPTIPIPSRGVPGFDPFIPSFATRQGAQRPPHPGVRRSQQGREKPKKVIAFSSSLNQAVKLHESENAWKPSYKSEIDSAEEAKIQELYKKVRGILNKLTPQKFETLLNQVKELEINTEEKLNGVIDLVFEKAIDEPNFSVPYANMCKQLALMKVPSSEKEGQQVNFRKLLLTKCQKEFEQDRSDELQRGEKIKQIEECDKEDKKKLLQEEFEEEERKNRRRQLGNIRFIGELFKLGMLIEPIMHECIKKLLNQGDEDSLECLCRLLTTIGKELELRKEKESSDDFQVKKEMMNGYFNEMQKIVDKRKTSSRVRFMLQDVIDLKKRGWIPRRDENNPKTIDQIHQEAEREAHEQQQMLQNMAFMPKRPPEDNRRKSSNTGRNTGNYEEGWITSSKSGKANCAFDPAKIKFSKQPELENIQLGPAGRSFTSWGRGSSGGYKPNTETEKSTTAVLTNRYMPLADQSFSNMETRRGSQRSTASSRESSRGRNSQVASLIRKTPSASKDRDNLIETVNRLTRTGQPEQKSVEPAKVPDVQNVNGKETSANTNVLKGAELSRDDIIKKTRPLMDEFLHNNDFEEAIRCITELASPSTMDMFITEAINQVLERSSQARFMFGQLLHNLVKSKLLSMEQYNKGLMPILEILEDYALDIPKIWEYLGEIIEPMIEGNSASLRFLKETMQPCIPSLSAGRLVSAILHCAAKTRGTIKVGEMWRESGLEWTDFLPPEENISSFIQLENLTFTVCPMKSQPTVEIPISEVRKKLEFYLNGLDNNEEIFDWVESHIGDERINEPSFVRAFVTVVFEHAITGSAESCELSVEKLKNRVPLLSRYVARKDELQLQALYAVQALVNRLGQPKGVLKQIFDMLYDDDIITEETFKEWEVSSDPAEMEGKGVALASVTPFFTWLREADVESEEG